MPSKAISWLVRFLSLLFHTEPSCESGFLPWFELQPLAVVQSLGGRMLHLPLVPDLPQHHHLPLLVPLDVALVARADFELQFGLRLGLSGLELENVAAPKGPTFCLISLPPQQKSHLWCSSAAPRAAGVCLFCFAKQAKAKMRGKPHSGQCAKQGSGQRPFWPL